MELILKNLPVSICLWLPFADEYMEMQASSYQCQSTLAERISKCCQTSMDCCTCANGLASPLTFMSATMSSALSCRSHIGQLPIRTYCRRQCLQCLHHIMASNPHSRSETQRVRLSARPPVHPTQLWLTGTLAKPAIGLAPRGQPGVPAPPGTPGGQRRSLCELG